MLWSCTGVAPPSLSPNIGGVYADRAQGGKESLVSFLLGSEAAATPTVRLTLDAAGLRVETLSGRHILRSPADFSCSNGTKVTLTRQVVGHIRLPPLIDQTVVTSYRFRKTDAGNLQMDIYSQTTASPYGLRLYGPEQLDRTLTWVAQPRP